MTELIPAIDIINGQCVRLTQGDYDQKKVYDTDPVNVARRFEQMGFKHLHVVDLDGAKSKHIVNEASLAAITHGTNLIVDFGGGIKSEDDLQKAFQAGAHQVTVGSLAVTHPEIFEHWLATYGTDRLILGADVKDGCIAINGWKEDSEKDLMSFLEHFIKCGVTQVLCTDISRDGTLQGPAIELYRSIMERYPTLRLIASGGVSGNKDIEALSRAGIPAVVCGKAFYEGRINLETLKL